MSLVQMGQCNGCGSVRNDVIFNSHWWDLMWAFESASPASLNTFNLGSLINKPTCFQSENPTCIDLILTNKKSLNSNILEVGIPITVAP